MMRLTHFDALHKNEPSSLQSTLFDKKEYLHTRDKIRKSTAAVAGSALSSLTTSLLKTETPTTEAALATQYERIQNTRTGENSPLPAELDDVPESCVPLYCGDDQRELFQSLCQYAEQPKMTVKDILVPLSHPLLMEQKYKRSDLTVEHLSRPTKMKFLARLLTRIAKNSRKTYEVNVLCNDYSMEYLLYEFVRSLHFDCKRFRDVYKGSEDVHGVVVFSEGLARSNSRLDVSLLLVYDSAVPPDLRTVDIFKQSSSATLFTIYLALVNTPEIRLFNYINLHPEEDITWATPIHQLSPNAQQCLLANFDYVETESDRKWNDYMATKAYKWSLIDNKTLFRETRTRPHSFISKDQYQVRLKKRHLKRGHSDDTAAPEIADILSQVLYSSYGNRSNDHNSSHSNNNYYSNNYSGSNLSISGSSDGGDGGGRGDGSIGSSTGSRRGRRSISPVPRAPKSMSYNDSNDHGDSSNNRHHRISSMDVDEGSHVNKSYYSSNRGIRTSTSPSPSVSSTTSSYDESYYGDNNLSRRNNGSLEKSMHNNSNNNKRPISSEMGESAKRMKHSAREGSKLASSLTAEPSDNRTLFSTSPLKRKRPITLSLSKKGSNDNGADGDNNNNTITNNDDNMDDGNNQLTNPEIDQTHHRASSSSPIAKYQRLLSPSKTKEESSRRESPTINRDPRLSTSTNRDPRLSVSPIRELEKPPILPSSSSSITTTLTAPSPSQSPAVDKQLPLPSSSSTPANENITSQKETAVTIPPQSNDTASKKDIPVPDTSLEAAKTLSKAESSLANHSNSTATDQQQGEKAKNIVEEKEEEKEEEKVEEKEDEKEEYTSTDNAMSEFEKALEKIHMQFQAALQE